MADKKYCVFRSDLMGHTDVAYRGGSARVYDASDNEIAVENGVIIELGDYVDGERDLYKATFATDSSKLENVGVVCTPEIFYDERQRNLDEYINEAGMEVRWFGFGVNQIFSITAEGFAGDPPAKGGEVGIGADGKLDATKSGFGKCIIIEKTSRYTYYVIKMGKMA